VLRSFFRALENLAVLDEAPRRTAMALALGVGLSFSPLLGLQVLIAVGITLAFRLSRIAVLVGLCANVPWIMLPWYALTTAGAAALLGTTSTGDLNARLGLLLSVPFYSRRSCCPFLSDQPSEPWHLPDSPIRWQCAC
jgi:uncharacterized protein (DUF2062 family)